MKRENYENYKWYPLTNNECWVEDLPEEFPNCLTLIYNINSRFGDYIRCYSTSSLSWESMASYGTYYFMIIEKPNN